MAQVACVIQVFLIEKAKLYIFFLSLKRFKSLFLEFVWMFLRLRVTIHH